MNMIKFGSIAQLIGIILLAFILVFAIDYLLPEQPLQGPGNCQSGWVAKVESAPFVYDGDQIITKVIVKSGQNCVVFTANGTNGCYWVMGVGTTSVKVSRVGNPGPECQEVSHVEFYAGQVEETPSPTVAPGTPTASVTPTETVVATTPFKFWTPTPNTVTPSGTPEDTGTPTQATGTPSAEESPTPTGTGTEPPDKRRSPTPPEPVLPAAGENGGNRDGVGIVFPAVFLGMVVLAFALAIAIKIVGGGDGGGTSL